MFFKEVEFVKLSRTTILVVFVTSSGMVHTRLVNTEEDLPPDLLAEMKVYMNERCEGSPFYTLRKRIYEDLRGTGRIFIAHGEGNGRPRGDNGE